MVFFVIFSLSRGRPRIIPSILALRFDPAIPDIQDIGDSTHRLHTFKIPSTYTVYKCQPVGWWTSDARLIEVDNRSLILFDRGDEIAVEAGEDGIRFLLVSGKLFGEPIAWYCPIVMNTQEELQRAFTELRQGTFLKENGQP